MSEEEEITITFKKRKQKANIRSKIGETEKLDDNEILNDDNSLNRTAIDEFRELKRLKLTSGKGINVLDLMLGSNQNKTNNKNNVQKNSGMIGISKLESELNLGHTFSVETNKRDEDGEMNKYIDKIMAERSQTSSNTESSTLSGKAPILDQTYDSFLKVIPEKLLNLARKTKQENQEMLSSQMLTSIPEIDLGVEERIKNIEKTEAARTKYFRDKALERQKSDKILESLAPKNISSCYKKETFTRFDQKYIQQYSPEVEKKQKQPATKKNQQIQYDFEPVVQIGDIPATLAVPRIEKSKLPGKNTPSDDFVFEKFRKNMHKR